MVSSELKEKSKDAIPDRIIEKLDMVGNGPGVYLMKDEKSRILYVGKARDLKKRLTSYFKGSKTPDIKTKVLIRKVHTFDTVVTRTEKEALILESTLIKRHRPRYNVVLKDDKRYPSLRLDMKETYPNLRIARKMKKDGALYFGPYSSAQSVRETLKLVQRHFKLRKCKTKTFKNRTRPCLNHQMGTCLGLCTKEVDPKVYAETVKEAVMFLKGHTDSLIRKIRTDMHIAAENKAFERAADLRDKLFALEKTVEKQHSVTTDFIDRDIIAVSGTKAHYLITVMRVRRGFLSGTHHYSVNETFSLVSEVIRFFILDYYEKAGFIPKEILVSEPCEEADILEEILKEQKGVKVSILHPKRGEKLRLLDLAVQNSNKELKERLTLLAKDTEMLLRLKRRMNLSNLPSRIECIDNSNISGAHPVSAIVVFEDGKPLSSAYRKYAIKTIEGPDDYATMAEVLKRRYGKGEKSQPYPDLLLVDGGRGQLNIALSVLKDLDLADHLEVAGIAKKNENIGELQDKIYVPGRANPINFSRDGDLLLFLMRIRDEAHRFVITFHRKKRKSASITSSLDNIKGIGKKRKAQLIAHFGGIKKIGDADIESLKALPGITGSIALQIKKALRSKK